MNKMQKTPRSPLQLKDLNISQSSSSTSATSISSEAPTGCLRFFLSHHSSKNTFNSKPSCYNAIKSPKSAPNVRNLGKKRSNLKNPDKISCRKVKKNSPAPHPCVNSMKKGRDFGSRSDLFDGGKKISSGIELKLSDDAEELKLGGKCRKRFDLVSGFELKLSDNDEELKLGRNPSSRYDLVDESVSKLSDNVEKSTPVRKWECGFDEGGCNELGVKVENFWDVSRSPTPPPPVQASVSPEIQGGSMSVVAATPNTCYAAGHVLSGVTDKRKCRPRGILTIGNNDLFGSGKTKELYSEDEVVVEVAKNGRDSIVPSPTKASVHWLLSPCDEKKSEGDDGDVGSDASELRLDRFEKTEPFKSIGCSSSPSSSLGFSSEVFNKSNSTISTSGANTRSSRSRSYGWYSDVSSEFRGVLGPSFDHMVLSPSPSSPVSTSGCKVENSPKQGAHRYDFEGVATPNLEDSIGSGNVIQTPESSSPCNYGQSHLNPQYSPMSPCTGLSRLSRDEISRLWFECELDSVTEVLRRVSLSPERQLHEADSPWCSFEFNPLIRAGSSVDLTLFRNAMDSHTSEVPDSFLHNLPDHEVRISWREGLASRIFEMDELDCCRCLSDEEDDANSCIDTFESSHEETSAIASNKAAVFTSDPCRATPQESTNSRCEGSVPVEGPKLSPESMCRGKECTHVSEDSSWKVCYRNNLFHV